MYTSYRQLLQYCTNSIEFKGFSSKLSNNFRERGKKIAEKTAFSKKGQQIRLFIKEEYIDFNQKK